MLQAKILQLLNVKDLFVTLFFSVNLLLTRQHCHTTTAAQDLGEQMNQVQEEVNKLKITCLRTIPQVHLSNYNHPEQYNRWLEIFFNSDYVKVLLTYQESQENYVFLLTITMISEIILLVQ